MNEYSKNAYNYFNITKSSIKLSNKIYNYQPQDNSENMNIISEIINEPEYDIVDIEKEYKLDIYDNLVDISWHITISDIEYTVSNSCKRILDDTSVTLEEIEKRSDGLIILGEILLNNSISDINECLNILKMNFKQK